MKKYLLLIGILSLLFSSCWTWSVRVFDDSTPEEKTARLFPYDVGTVTEYNGITVNWKKSYSLDDKLIQIPAGETLLQFDVNSRLYFSNYSFTVRGENILFRYNFQPQKTYVFHLVFHSNSGIYGLNVYAYNYGESMRDLRRPSRRRLVEFVPFLNGNELREAVF